MCVLYILAIIKAIVIIIMFTLSNHEYLSTYVCTCVQLCTCMHDIAPNFHGHENVQNL